MSGMTQTSTGVTIVTQMRRMPSEALAKDRSCASSW